MKIPVTLVDLVLVMPDGVHTTVATFRAEAAARRVLSALKAEQGAGTLQVVAGADFGIVPRTDVAECESLDACRQAGYAVSESVLRDIWERVYAAPADVQEALGLSPERADAELAPTDSGDAAAEVGP